MTNKIALKQINNDHYQSDCGWVVKRVYGRIQIKYKDIDYTLNCNGEWVVFNPKWEAIDRCIYLNDLIDKHGFRKG